MQADCGVSILGEFKSHLDFLDDHGPGQQAVGGPALAGRLDQMTSRDPWQAQPICDSVKDATVLSL